MTEAPPASPGTPQEAIFVEGTGAHWFQHFATDPDATAAQVLAAVRIAQQVAAAATANLVVGFGAAMTARLGMEMPPGLKAFTEIGGSSGRVAVATQEDVFLWIHGDRHDLNFEVALAARRAFEEIGELARETPSWVYRDSRDLTGFIDGTENPPVEEARELAVIAGGPGAGGSFVLAQRWIHDLDGFAALPTAEQEQIIGRTKPDSVELEDLPPHSHLGRVVHSDEDGEEIEIYRRSVPYGTSTEAGLYFLAFTDDLAKIDLMLESMFGATGDGRHDPLVTFSETVSGAYYYAPSRETLQGLGLAG
ncbi:MAG: Dyp-type peroxidase [Acidimicrobiia bacterium]|nr:Dyp-type peroxidase [Acidimicrobiia bacterium]MYC44562.1 Dyp-type peroxidase [Acidimicrobiia bacterium]MYI19173.1 Dyp-type peroxidase [Acidimicrobiia bacterium]